MAFSKTVLSLLFLFAVQTASATEQCSAVFTPSSSVIEIEYRAGNPVGDAIDSFLHFFGIGNGPAGARPVYTGIASADYQGSQLGKSLIHMAENNALLNQLDPRLGQLGLLVPNGGLCASTCAVNLVGAMIDQASPATAPAAFKQMAPQLINGIVQGYSEKSKQVIIDRITHPQNQADVLIGFIQALDPRQTDARYGAQNKIVAQTLKPAIELLGGQLHDTMPATPANLQWASQKDSLMLGTAALTDSKGAVTNQHALHALIILKIDVASQEVYVSDPNRPNEIFNAKYTMNAQGEMQFFLKVSYTQSGLTVATLKLIEVVERVRPIAIPLPNAG